MLNQITCRSLTFLLALAAGIGLLSTPLAHADKQHDLSDPTAWTYFSNADSSACASDCAAVLREARYAAYSPGAASTSVAHIVRIAEPVARASTTAGVLHQDAALQQFTDIAKGSVDSTASVPCRMSHASVPEGLRSITAPPADLVRLSVGLEGLAANLEQALDGTQCESFLQRGERS